MNRLATLIACVFVGPAWAQGYTIAGYVVGNDRTPLVGASMALAASGAAIAMTQTDSKGYYHFDDLAVGSYEVTATYAEYRFAPSTRNIALSGNSSAEHFVAVHVGVDVDRTLVSRGEQRHFVMHVPRIRTSSSPLPLVFLLHGGGGDGRGMELLTLGGFNALADSEQFVVVYPDGTNQSWNDGRTPSITNADDVGFISDIIDDLAANDGIDKNRVYAAGISNGAKMSNRLASELSNKIAAIAPVCGQLLTSIELAPSRPMPVLLFQGLSDPLNPPEGGGEPKHAQWVLRSVAETAEFWRRSNGCGDAPETLDLPDINAADGTRVQRSTWASCAQGAEVVLYEIVGGGHTWPSGLQYLPESAIGRTSRDIDSNQIMWDFFKRHALPSVPTEAGPTKPMSGCTHDAGVGPVAWAALLVCVFLRRGRC